MSASTTLPPLRERKKRQTRDSLIDTALAMFTARGFTEVTLDELCNEVSVSKRTFFRIFTSKEDVAMAPLQDLLLAFLRDLEVLEPGTSPLIEFSRDALLSAVKQTANDAWARRAVLSCQLAQRHQSIDAHGLRFCQQATDHAYALLRDRFGIRTEDEVAFHLAGDMIAAVFRYALAQWSTRASAGDTRRGAKSANLADEIQRTFAALPQSFTVATRAAPTTGQ